MIHFNSEIEAGSCGSHVDTGCKLLADGDDGGVNDDAGWIISTRINNNKDPTAPAT